MPTAPPKACTGPGPHSNPRGLADSGWLCNACRAKANTQANEQSTLRRKRLPSAYERHFRPTLIKSGNVNCQRVIETNGQRRRCPERAEICHHLLDTAEYPQFIVEWRNVALVCRPHNPNMGGDPGGLEYLPTGWPAMLGGQPASDVAPGQVIPPGTTLWTLSSQRKALLG